MRSNPPLGRELPIKRKPDQHFRLVTVGNGLDSLALPEAEMLLCGRPLSMPALHPHHQLYRGQSAAGNNPGNAR
jgi:hypothetical protein